MAATLRGYGGPARQAARAQAATVGMVRLRCANPAMNSAFYLGPDPPTLDGGVGGWEVTARPRAIGMTTWGGVEPFTLSVNILLGHHMNVAEPDIQEQNVAQLLDVARGTVSHKPGIVTIDGIPGLPADRWVINGIEWGDVIRDRQMNRIRQLVTITFLEYQPPEYHKLKGRALKPPKPKAVVYTVKAKDTPVKIARNRRCKWTDIKALNKKGLIKTANQNLKDGSKILVPVKHAPPPKKHRGKGKH